MNKLQSEFFAPDDCAFVVETYPEPLKSVLHKFKLIGDNGTHEAHWSIPLPKIKNQNELQLQDVHIQNTKLAIGLFKGFIYKFIEISQSMQTN
jgi:hypothetical protein